KAILKRLENAARQIAELDKKESVPTNSTTLPENPANFSESKPKVSLTESTKRRRSDSNRCIKVLQTSPLPLGYGAITQDGCHYNKRVVESKSEGVPCKGAPFFFSYVGTRPPTCTPAGEPVKNQYRLVDWG